MSSIRSASSRTRQRTRSSRTSRRSTRSCSRPGVATRMCAPRAAFDCARDPRAAVDGRDAEIPPLGKQRELGRHLGRQLAGRHENERGRLAVGGLGALDDRQAEGEGLARAGRRLRQDVEAGERVRKDERLDREWCGDASLLERLRNVSADSERAERLLRHVVVRLLGRGSRQNDSERPKEEREARSHRTTGCRPCSHCSCRGCRRKEVSALC